MLTKVFGFLAIVAVTSMAHVGSSYASCADEFKSCLEKCEANKYDIKACKGLNQDRRYNGALEKCDLEAGQALGACSEGCKTAKQACEVPEAKKESKS